MNQILCGDTVIDTDDVQLAIKITGDDAQRRVFLRGGRTAILRGEEEAAFDVWAATLPKAGGDGIDMEQIIDRIIARDRDDPFPTEKEWREWLRECLRGKTDPKPLCKTCACYDAESGHCTEFAGNHYPACFVEREEKAEIECAFCRHYSGPPSYYCVPGRGWERPGCYEKGNRKALRAARKAAEAAGAGSSDAADKVELPPRGTLCQSCQFYSPDTRRCTKREREEFPECHVDNVWVCSGCGLALGTDMKGQDVRVSSGGCELYIQGEVRIQSNDVPLVMCPKCGTANLWPDELRERVGRSKFTERLEE